MMYGDHYHRMTRCLCFIKYEDPTLIKHLSLSLYFPRLNFFEVVFPLCL